MGRIRTIKPEFWLDERLATLPRDVRMLFIGLWNVADDFGRLRGHPAYIRGQVFPYDDDVDVPAGLRTLEDAGRIVRYQRDGQSFIWVRHFSEHQKMDKRAESKLPEPSAEEMAGSAEKRAEPAEKLAEPAHKTAEPAEKRALEWNREQGKEQGTGNRKAAPAAAAPARRQMSDVLCAIFLELRGVKYEFQEAQDGKALSWLMEREASEVEKRWRKGLELADKWPGVSTIAQLRSRWNDLAPPPAQRALPIARQKRVGAEESVHSEADVGRDLTSGF